MSSSESPAYRFLSQIAENLSSGDVSFPTFLDATLKVRMALKEQNMTAEGLARVVVAEPLLSVKVIRLANSVALNPGGKPVADVKTAVVRVGFASIRSLAIAVAMDQLLQAKEMAPYAGGAKALWEHSLDVAAVSFVVAKRVTRLNPHEAMFAGLVHDIGQFYLLSQVARQPDVVTDSSELARLLWEWHASVGHAVLNALGVPEQVVKAVDEHEVPVTEAEPRTLAQVLFVANQVAARRNPYVTEELLPETTPLFDRQLIAEILVESGEELNSILAALRG